MLNDAFRSASKENVPEPRVAMRGHDDQIGRDLLRDPADFIERWCTP
jgi:hypothetical protein